MSKYLHFKNGSPTPTFDGVWRPIDGLFDRQFAEPELNMKVLPVNFSTDHKKLMANLKMFMSDGLLAIDTRFDKLITSEHSKWHWERFAEAKYE